MLHVPFTSTFSLALSGSAEATLRQVQVEQLKPLGYCSLLYNTHGGKSCCCTGLCQSKTNPQSRNVVKGRVQSLQPSSWEKYFMETEVCLSSPETRHPGFPWSLLAKVSFCAPNESMQELLGTTGKKWGLSLFLVTLWLKFRTGNGCGLQLARLVS